MAIAKIKLDESTKLDFGVSITGAGGKPEARFVIEGKDFAVSFPCKPTNEGVEVEIQGLSKVFTAGEYAARLEVVLENKIYTPLLDKIEFEPSVTIQTQSKVVKPVQESVKISTVTVKKPVINEELLRKTQAATIIAKSLGYVPEAKETPTQIINHAMEQSQTMTTEQHDTLKQMLTLAESVGIPFDADLIPAVVQEVIVEAKEEKKEESSEDNPSEDELEGMIAHIKDWDDIIDAYEPGELGMVDDETGEEVDGDLSNELKEDVLNEVLSRAERLKSRIRFARTEGKRERKMKIALKKHSSNATINKRARHIAVKLMETKLARGKNLANLSVPEKERIERIIQKRSAVIGRLALKLTSRVRTIEKNRLTHKAYTK